MEWFSREKELPPTSQLNHLEVKQQECPIYHPGDINPAIICWAILTADCHLGDTGLKFEQSSRDFL